MFSASHEIAQQVLDALALAGVFHIANRAGLVAQFETEQRVFQVV